MTRHAAQGIAKCEHALALDRNLAAAHSAVGFGKIFVRRAKEAEAHINEALRLSPRDTTAYVWMDMAGLANLHLGGYEQAVAWCRRSIEANRNFPAAHFDLAAALVLVGRFDEANAAVKAGLALNPIYTVSRVRAAWTAMSDEPTYLVQIEHHARSLAQGRSPRTMSAVRRPAAIVAADVPEYSRLIAADETTRHAPGRLTCSYLHGSTVAMGSRRNDDLAFH
jgi:tetratricopeptide (TPR) repeat protein